MHADRHIAELMIEDAAADAARALRLLHAELRRSPDAQRRYDRAKFRQGLHFLREALRDGRGGERSPSRG